MDREKTLDRMRRLCSAREYCKSDILKKIDAVADDDVDREEIIETLIREKFLDELRYAKAFVNDKSLLQGWGAAKIKYALNLKNVDRDTIDDALQSIDEEAAFTRLNDILKNKYGTLKGKEEERLAKLYRFAMGRGYTYKDIKAVYDNIRTDKRD